MFRVPTATYRIQFNAQFTLADARRIAPYLARLGITDIYASPILRARTGSTHGYDTVDATAINPDLGTDDDFTELTGELDRLGMGFLLDIVPNHMAASHENAWWVSVLENGLQSRFVHFFDIDWRDDKVLLPILGRPYGETLESGEIRLGFDVDGLFFSYWEKRLPLAPRSYPLVLRDSVEALPAEGIAVELRELVENETVIANSRFLKETLWRIQEQSTEFRDAFLQTIRKINADVDALDRLLAAQWYRVAYWRIASETINYRRFFDVTDLVGLCIENPEVFEARNRRIVEWIGEGKVTGLRIDHIDGLHDPVNYLTKMQSRLGGQFYLVVEKILARDETLPAAFRVAGTTGYDFVDATNALFVDPEGLAKLTDVYRSFTGAATDFDDLVYLRKKQVIQELFSGEMRALGARLAALAVADRNARDFAPSELLAALIEITACMPVYRTYIREHPVSASDRAFLQRAIDEARRRAVGAIDERLFRFIELVLFLETPAYIESEREKWQAFVMHWQQFTGRVMAKGVEDTAFYDFNRLVSLNEVGGDPGRGTDVDPVAELHARNERIARDWPLTMNASSTHDTKRSEDVRARISVLSEIPEQWARMVRRWSKLSGGFRDRNVEWLVYQTLVGAWPIDAGRLTQYLEKAAREAKTHTSWLSPNEDYERALKDFVTALLSNEAFLASFERFQKRVAFHGFLSSLAQVVLKSLAPGIPDFYQGTELWDFSLVDPDNRRPVDYEQRIAALESLGATDIAALLRRWPDGRVKLFVTARCLELRARHADVFRDGDYRALDAGANAFAFTRGASIAVIVPRLTTRLVRPPQLPLGDVWEETSIALAGRWKNAFTGAVVEGEKLRLRNVLESFPVTVLIRLNE
jgi:(1->4)-alpha-D-glucan 1-alpha-D-glucosylmutase